MSCDYQRWNGWERVSRYCAHHIFPKVSPIAEEILKELAKELIKEIWDDLSESNRQRLGRKQKEDSTAYAIEVIYLHAKVEAVKQQKKYTPQERSTYAEDTRALMIWMMGIGVPEDKLPLHKPGELPRISSQVGYSAIMQKLLELGIIEQQSRKVETHQSLALPEAIREIKLLREEHAKMTDKMIAMIGELSDLVSQARRADSCLGQIEKALSGQDIYFDPKPKVIGKK